MENMHGTHTEDTSGWLSAVAGFMARIRRRTVTRPRGPVVTPWSGRSPAGWSA